MSGRKVVPLDAPYGERFFQALRDLPLKVAVAKLGKDRQVAVKPSVSRSIPQEEVRDAICGGC